MKAIVRRATEGDAGVLSVLATEVWLDTYAHDGVTPAFARHLLRDFSVAAMEEAINAAQVFVCCRGDLIFGYAKLTASDASLVHHASAELATLYVRRHQFRQGYGSMLLDVICAEARRAGHGALCATVHHRNLRAFAFYARHGFRHVGDWSFRFDGERVPNRVYARAL